ncbi:tail protein X [Sphingomonas panni]|uniref:tail protein X n=1 Tax=Sphingomonas panni TaxID=237612 RepID=UPI001F5BA7F1|nr:tail protein X [Sphingomonas panni]
MADTVTARQGDTIDLILHRDRGLGPEAIGTVLAANPGLAALGAVLPVGTAIIIPDAAAAAPATRPLLQIWD